MLFYVTLFQSVNLRCCDLQEKKKKWHIRTQKTQDSLLAFLLTLGDLEHITLRVSVSTNLKPFSSSNQQSLCQL